MTDTNNTIPDYSEINNLPLDNKINITSELKRSFTETDMNLEEELRDLKKVIETQKKKITQLEKRQTSIIKKGSQLEDAVNDLFDMVEGEHDTYDPDYLPGEEDDEDTLLRFNINAETLDQFGKTLEENLNKLSELESQVPPQRKKRVMHSGSPNPNHINQVEIELTPEELRKIRNGSDPSFIQNIIKKTKQKADPIEYIREYCAGEKWTKARTTRLINQAKEYLLLINSNDSDETLDLDFFIQATETKRKDIIKALQDLKTITAVDTPYKFRILSSAMDLYSKKIALYKTDQLLNTEPGTGEYYKLKTWLDTLLDIPWGEHTYINVNDAMIPAFLSSARETMDTVIHGQDETKDIIIQIISKMLTNPGNVAMYSRFMGLLVSAKRQL